MFTTAQPNPTAPYDADTTYGQVHIRPVDLDVDLDLIYAWTRSEYATFWGMRGHSREHVRDVYAYLTASVTHHAWLVHVENRPAALVQTYDPAADEVGAYLLTRPGDVGMHLLIAPPAERRPHTSSLVVREIQRWLFTVQGYDRLVIEPDARNRAAVLIAARTGFERGPQIELSDKRAELMWLTRDVWSARTGAPATAMVG